MPHDQRETPYLDAALRYRAIGYTPFHTPGHKLGKGAPAGLREFVGDTGLSADLAMAGGVEDTRESTGLIRLAEDYAAEAWGADRTWFLVNGSTSGIHALLLTLCGPGDTVIVPRNAHKSMLAGLIFTGAMPVYMEPAIDPVWGIPLQVRAGRRAGGARARPRTRAPSSSPRPPTTASAPTCPASARWRTTPASRSSPTRRGGRTCASAPSCPSTP